MNIIGIIPARMASSRFPNKPMADILGMPMIGHCFHRSKMSNILTDVYVATCDNEIYEYIESIGGKAVMTSDKHERASDRTAEAVDKIEKEIGKKVDIVAMIQGDEPLTTPLMVESVIKPLIDDSRLIISNLIGIVKSKDDYNDPNEVKLVTDRQGNAMYFSRSPIPSDKKWDKEITVYKQLGIIVFRRTFLSEYNSMQQTTLEKIESIDMLRVLENGIKIKTIITKESNIGVDTKEELLKAEKLMGKDKLYTKYSHQHV